MITKEETRIITDEIERMERAWRNAQDRYAYSGSASTDHTMHKYDTLRNALETYLNNGAQTAAEKAMLRYQDQLVRAHRAVEDNFRKGRISDTAYVEITRILMEG
jgi:hypothetical protein